MKQKIVLLFLIVLFLGQNQFFGIQFIPKELSLRPELEKFLKTAEIVRYKEIGEGVTKPFKLYLKNGELEHAGCWKNPKGMRQGYLEGWQYEIAAYEMDKLLGLNMIPPTVEKEFKGKKGSLQFWVTSEMSDLERMDKGIRIPKNHLISWNRQKYLTRAFDCLIGNEDRTQQNIRYTKDWRTILIDHSRSFRSSRKFTRNLVYGKNGIKGEKLFRQLPRKFVDKIDSLDFESISAAVGSYLTDKEIKAVLKRKELLLKEIKEMIEEKGEAKVLY